MSIVVLIRKQRKQFRSPKLITGRVTEYNIDAISSIVESDQRQIAPPMHSVCCNEARV